MKIPSFRCFAAVCLVSISCAGGLSAAPEYKQPKMEESVRLLQDALNSDEPIPLLRAAKKELARIEHNKGGFRLDAIQIVDRAIVDAQAGEKEKVKGEIKNAIAAIHSGMAHSH